MKTGLDYHLLAVLSVVITVLRKNPRGVSLEFLLGEFSREWEKMIGANVRQIELCYQRIGFVLDLYEKMSMIHAQALLYDYDEMKRDVLKVIEMLELDDRVVEDNKQFFLLSSAYLSANTDFQIRLCHTIFDCLKNNGGKLIPIDELAEYLYEELGFVPDRKTIHRACSFLINKGVIACDRERGFFSISDYF
ncbi:MAG: hypothetical protein WCW87_03700 [Candidatus Paceibacterota bacterium]